MSDGRNPLSKKQLFTVIGISLVFVALFAISIFV